MWNFNDDETLTAGGQHGAPLMTTQTWRWVYVWKRMFVLFWTNPTKMMTQQHNWEFVRISLLNLGKITILFLFINKILNLYFEKIH